ncbi:YqjF family protein [Spirosoma soli]|uniref:YqjF family protein n=1 Tax=Spirosoma soli TaxID=1770529 RepID=A0ABW5M8M7_9BACT
MEKRSFLTAQWRNLLMLNYEVDPSILQPYLPPTTELDLWQGKALVSMVGFRFLETKVLGIKWPWHVNFDEVNLRFYVRHFDGATWKRGAVFVSEIVPKPMIALVANTLYNERYKTMPVRHDISRLNDQSTSVLYEWKYKGHWNALGATISNTLRPMLPDSAEAFIFEHYWGYNKLSGRTTHEYQVEHVSWQIADTSNAFFDADVTALYGEAFSPYLRAQPYSAFYADGSDVTIRIARKLRL